MAIEEVFTVKEAAARLKVAPYTIREWLKQGTLGGLRTGKMWRIRERGIQAFIDEQASAVADKGALRIVELEPVGGEGPDDLAPHA